MPYGRLPDLTLVNSNHSTTIAFLVFLSGFTGVCAARVCFAGVFVFKSGHIIRKVRWSRRETLASPLNSVIVRDSAILAAAIIFLCGGRVHLSIPERIQISGFLTAI